MRYTTLLFDLDHTLFDFDASESAAFSKTLATAGIDDPDRYRDMFAAINTALWADVESGVLSPNEVRTRRFCNLIDGAGIDADPIVLADHYVIGLGAEGDLFPGAREVLEDLAEAFTLALVSNGIGQVQRDKIARLGLDTYFDSIVISGEVGTSKPGTGIFDIVFDRLGNPDRTTVLMIGDSLTSDIRGGINYGIDTMWYAPDEPLGTRYDATYRIGDLNEIADIVAGD
ncbi:MAG: YjjG family noncanonical pyrimidine nucleotidase [Acidimicrobiia bacterium]